MSDEEIQHDPLVETPAEAPPAVGASTTPTEAPEAPAVTDASETPEAPAADTGFQKRINKITADKYAEKRRADALEAELAGIKKAAPPAEPAEEITLEGHDYDQEAYTEALINARVAKAMSQAQTGEAQRQAGAQRDQVSRDFSKRASEANIEGYSEAVAALASSGVPITQELMETIQGIENGPAVAYHLGTNLDLAAEIAAKPFGAAAARLGVLSAEISRQATPGATKAPDPIQPVGAPGNAGKALHEYSMEEIEALPG